MCVCACTHAIVVCMCTHAYMCVCVCVCACTSMLRWVGLVKIFKKICISFSGRSPEQKQPKDSNVISTVARAQASYVNSLTTEVMTGKNRGTRSKNVLPSFDVKHASGDIQKRKCLQHSVSEKRSKKKCVKYEIEVCGPVPLYILQRGGGGGGGLYSLIFLYYYAGWAVINFLSAARRQHQLG